MLAVFSGKPICHQKTVYMVWYDCLKYSKFLRAIIIIKECTQMTNTLNIWRCANIFLIITLSCKSWLIKCGVCDLKFTFLGECCLEYERYNLWKSVLRIFHFHFNIFKINDQFTCHTYKQGGNSWLMINYEKKLSVI